jgi:hypothetical protein
LIGFKGELFVTTAHADTLSVWPSSWTGRKVGLETTFFVFFVACIDFGSRRLIILVGLYFIQNISPDFMKMNALSMFYPTEYNTGFWPVQPRTVHVLNEN